VESNSKSHVHVVSKSSRSSLRYKTGSDVNGAVIVVVVMRLSMTSSIFVTLPSRSSIENEVSTVKIN